MLLHTFTMIDVFHHYKMFYFRVGLPTSFDRILNSENILCFPPTMLLFTTRHIFMAFPKQNKFSWSLTLNLINLHKIPNMLAYSVYSYWQPPMASTFHAFYQSPCTVTTQKNLVCLNKQQDSMGGVVFPQCSISSSCTLNNPFPWPVCHVFHLESTWHLFTTSYIIK